MDTRDWINGGVGRARVMGRVGVFQLRLVEEEGRGSGGGEGMGEGKGGRVEGWKGGGVR